MKLLRKSRYALCALIDLSVHAQDNYVTLSSIAERNSISPQYLEQIFASLRKAGIVKGVKGQQGGYILNREPGNISVAMVLEAVEGAYLYEADIPEGVGNKATSITVQKLLVDRVNEQLEELLRGMTLADLQKDYVERSCCGQNMYYI